MPRALVLVLVLAACSAPSGPPPVAPPTPVVAAAREPACTARSRLCDLVALSKSAKPEELAATLYGEDGAAILDKLRAKGLEALIVDPGIVLRLDEVLAFPAQPGEGPWQFRARLSAKLGTVRVYRGLAVTPGELAAITKEGILAASLRGTEVVPPTHLMDQLIKHLAGMAGPADTMLSVSYDPAVSRCVASSYMRGDTTKSVHVWTVEIPALDVLAVAVPSALCPAVEPGTLDCNPPRGEGITPAIRRFACRNFYDPKVESFVQGRIDPGEVIEIKADSRTDDCKDVMAVVRAGLRETKATQAQFCAPT